MAGSSPEQTLELPIPIEVDATLAPGEIQSNDNEDFVPMIVTAIFPTGELTTDDKCSKNTTPTDTYRSIREIALEIQSTWLNPNSHAYDYLYAMLSLNTLADSYGEDSARTIIGYFLSNASGWKGEDARRIKAELNKIAGFK